MAVQFPGFNAQHSGTKGNQGFPDSSHADAFRRSLDSRLDFRFRDLHSLRGQADHRLTLTPNKQRLLAVNSIDARLCVYDVSDGGNNEPILYAEIPVGLEPVAVAAATNDEAWVVNEVSDTVSIVSLTRRVVEATAATLLDEPSDVVFAGGKAFVSCARNKLIRVFDVASRTEIGTIPVQGDRATRAGGEPIRNEGLCRLPFMSGNQTTIVPADKLPLSSRRPRTALIVPASDSRITFTVLDHDVAQIDVGTQAVDRYFSNSGNSLMDVAVHPQTGDVWTANMEPRNLVAAEPALEGSRRGPSHHQAQCELRRRGKLGFESRSRLLRASQPRGIRPSPCRTSCDRLFGPGH